LALTFSAVGHPVTTDPRWLSVTADTLHLLAMAAWLGGLVVLAAAVLPHREPAEVRAVLPVFSRVAFASVVTLAVTGSYAAWHGIGTVHAIFTTTYGWLVAGKVALFLGLMALGNFSRVAVQRQVSSVPVAYAMSDTALDEPMQADEPLSESDAERLRRSVLVEIAVAGCVLVLTAVLVAQPRGEEAIATRELRPATASADLGDGSSAEVSVTPGRHGTVVIDVSLNGTDATKVTATAALPGKQLGPIPVPLTANGTGQYTASNVNLPAAGDWLISLVVTTSAFDATAAQVKIHLY
ncbi:MAG: CopD family protein, partial [Pseudonocardiales bacterium]